MTSDKAWTAMTVLERNTLVVERVLGWRPIEGGGNCGLYWHPEEKQTKMLWDSPIHKARQKLRIRGDKLDDGFAVSPTSTWPGFGLVVEAMRAKGFSLKMFIDLEFTKLTRILWTRFHDGKIESGRAELESEISATALAAVRALGKDTK